MVKDPVCGMNVNKKAIKGLTTVKNGKKYFFCSKHCKDTFDNNIPWYKSNKFSKIFPYFLGVALIIGTLSSIYFNFMVFYMGLFFIVFSLFKMPDWKGFSEAFKGYDLLAKTIPHYSLIYPLIELTFGIMFLTGNYIAEVALITLIIMGTGAVSVGIKLAKREKFQCACLGTWINVPLTKVTLLENVLMFIMALLLIL